MSLAFLLFALLESTGEFVGEVVVHLDLLATLLAEDGGLEFFVLLQEHFVLVLEKKSLLLGIQNLLALNVFLSFHLTSLG